MTSPLNVMLLEDRESDARLIVHELTTAGFEPRWTRVDSEAAFLEAFDPSLDLILADHDVPGWHTMDVLTLIQSRGLDIPFIMVSGTIGEDAAVAAMRLGVTDYLLKDRLGRLGAAIRQALDGRRLRLERRRIERSLAESDGRFLALSAAAFEAVAFHEAGVIVDVNTSFEELFGYSRQELIGRKVLDLTAPDSHEIVLNAVRGRRQTAYEVFARTKGGATFRAEVSARSITHQGRELRVAVIRDITERHRADRALLTSESRFRELAETIQDVFYTVDVISGRVLYVSPGYRTVWGRSCDSLYERSESFLETILPDDRPLVEAAARRRMAGQNTDIEYRIVLPDSEVRWIREQAYPVVGPAGHVERIVGTARDITERTRAAVRLREQASLLDIARDAIVVSDLDNRISYWNKSAERVYGWTADEVIGHVLDPADYKRPGAFRLAMEAVRRSGEWVGELQRKTKHGDLIVTESRWTLVRDAHGQPRNILMINTDITEKKTLELQFLRAQRLENIGTLAGGIAHDLNNVLTPIIMSLKLLQDTVADEPSRVLIAGAASSAARGAAMVAQVLAFARGNDPGQLAVPMVDLLGEIERMAHETFPRNIEILTSVSRDLRPVVGDQTQIHQVLLNLCVNARDAMPNGGLLTLTAANADVDRIQAATSPDAKAGPYVVVQVADTGTGIPHEVLDKIFDPFFTTKDLGRGTGLGLSTSRKIVTSHGGFLRVESAPGIGTQFWVYLPAELGRTPLEPAVKHPVKAVPRGRGETVLLVDDEALIRQVGQRALTGFGYEVMTAADGAEAVALYAKHASDIAIVVIDMMMPVLDGAAAIARLKELNPSVRVVATSGLALAGQLAADIDATGVRLLAKPYDPDQLVSLLQQVLADEGQKGAG